MSETRKGLIGPLEGSAPGGGSTVDFYVPSDTVQKLKRVGPTHKFNLLYSVPEILRAPQAVFEGLERPGLENGLAYVGVPAEVVQADGIKVPPRPNCVLVVFISNDHRGHIVYDWDWRKTDPTDPILPLNHQQDFRRRIR